MIQFDDRREREQRASLCSADGLFDTGIGVGLLLLGFATMLGAGGVAGLYLVLLIPIVRAAKRVVTMPRMHHLDFIPDPDAGRRIARVRAVRSVSMGMLAALGVLALFMSRAIPIPISKWLQANAIVIFGFLLSSLFALLAWGTAIKRYRSYAAAAAVALVFGHWFNMSPAWYFLLLGALTAASGAAVLARFAKTYPRLNGRGRLAYTRHYRLASGRYEE